MVGVLQADLVYGCKTRLAEVFVSCHLDTVGVRLTVSVSGVIFGISDFRKTFITNHRQELKIIMAEELILRNKKSEE